VVRLLADGSLDPTFGNGGRVATDIATTAPPLPPCVSVPCTVPPLVSPADDATSDIAVTPDGKIVAGGWTTGQQGNDFALVRYRPDGTLDPTFGKNGRVTTSLTKGDDTVVAVHLRPDGKIVAVGRTDEFNQQADHGGLVRYLPDGTLDPTFGTGGIATSPALLPYGSAMDPDGNVIVVGRPPTRWEGSSSSPTGRSWRPAATPRASSWPGTSPPGPPRRRPRRRLPPGRLRDRRRGIRGRHRSRRPRPASASGWSAPTAASSPSATPPSTARWATPG
jgi:uncharacterized delta-60 repeat protein